VLIKLVRAVHLRKVDQLLFVAATMQRLTQHRMRVTLNFSLVRPQEQARLGSMGFILRHTFTILPVPMRNGVWFALQPRLTLSNRVQGLFGIPQGLL